MKEGPDIARIAALIGDPARANMLTALMAGRALTARELADEAGITPQTGSGHLGKLRDAGLIDVVQQGRHRYFQLASDNVAGALEGLMALAESRGPSRTRPGPRDERLRHARGCYKHLAGAMGVRIYDSLRERGLIGAAGKGLSVTASGADRLADSGIDLGVALKGHVHCRECLDWSERRMHLAGPLGTAILTHVLDSGWALREADSRVIRFTRTGEAAFLQAFPLEGDRQPVGRRA